MTTYFIASMAVEETFIAIALRYGLSINSQKEKRSLVHFAELTGDLKP